MKLSQAAINELPENGRLRKLLAAELNVDVRTVNRCIEENDDKYGDNSILTTVKSVQVISRETGLLQNEIVTESKAHAA